MSTVQLRIVVLGSLAHPEYDYYCLRQQQCPLYRNAVAKGEATKLRYVKSVTLCHKWATVVAQGHTVKCVHAVLEAESNNFLECFCGIKKQKVGSYLHSQLHFVCSACSIPFQVYYHPTWTPMEQAWEQLHNLRGTTSLLPHKMMNSSSLHEIQTNCQRTGWVWPVSSRRHNSIQVWACTQTVLSAPNGPDLPAAFNQASVHGYTHVETGLTKNNAAICGSTLSGNSNLSQQLFEKHLGT